jgi:hypothetical protein
VFWLLRLWLIGLILVLGWAIVSYVLTRNRTYLLKARAVWRGSLYLAFSIFIIWLLLRLLRL